MQQKAKKTISHVTPVRPLTDEEKKERVIRFRAQKREQYAISILCGLCQGVSSARAIVKADMHSTTIAIDTAGIVEDAVKMADELLEKLYPIKEETPAEKERERLKGNLKEEVCASDVCAYRGKNVCTIKRDEYCPMFKAKEQTPVQTDFD